MLRAGCSFAMAERERAAEPQQNDDIDEAENVDNKKCNKTISTVIYNTRTWLYTKNKLTYIHKYVKMNDASIHIS